MNWDVDNSTFNAYIKFSKNEKVLEELGRITFSEGKTPLEIYNTTDKLLDKLVSQGRVPVGVYIAQARLSTIRKFTEKWKIPWIESTSLRNVEQPWKKIVAVVVIVYPLIAGVTAKTIPEALELLRPLLSKVKEFISEMAGIKFGKPDNVMFI